MPGAGAIFIGRMFEALPVTLLVFAVAYVTARKRQGIINSTMRVVSRFLYTFTIAGIIFAIFYDSIVTGFGMTADSGIQGIFEVPAQFILALMASPLVINGIGRSRQKTENRRGK